MKGLKKCVCTKSLTHSHPQTSNGSPLRLKLTLFWFWFCYIFVLKIKSNLSNMILNESNRAEQKPLEIIVEVRGDGDWSD